MASGLTYWKFIVDVLFPVAFVLLVLLNIPAPRKLRRGIVMIVDKVLGFPLVGNFQLLHVVLVVTGGSFAETTRQTIELQRQQATEMIETPNVMTGLLAKKWRAERNFWLSFFCFTLWCLLACFYRLAVYTLKLEEQVHGQRPAVTAGVPAKKGALPSAPPLEAGATQVQMADVKKTK